MFHNPFEGVSVQSSRFTVLSCTYCLCSSDQEPPSDGDKPFSDFWDGSLQALTVYILHRLELSNHIIDEVGGMNMLRLTSCSSPHFGAENMSSQS
jgi:hypothetical protein